MQNRISRILDYMINILKTFYINIHPIHFSLLHHPPTIVSCLSAISKNVFTYSAKLIDCLRYWTSEFFSKYLKDTI